MKRIYQKPVLRVVKIQQTHIICASQVTSVNGNGDMDFGGGGSGPARARQHGGIGLDDWDE